MGTRVLGRIVIVAVAALLAGCGGGGGGGGGGGDPAPRPNVFSIGGKVAGLRQGDAVLLKNGADAVRVAAGTYTFPTKLQGGTAYSVTAEAQAGYSCTVANATGTVSGADVINVDVDCSSGPSQIVLAGKQSPIGFPAAVAADGKGNTFVLDRIDQVVLKLDASGNLSTLAGSRGLAGYKDGKGSEARFFFDAESAMTLGDDGSLAIFDSCNAVIRKVTLDGIVTTLAGMQRNKCSYGPVIPVSDPLDGSATTARFGAVRAIASDRKGGFYVADDFVSPGLRHVSASGAVTTISWPDPATKWIRSMTVDRNGAVLFVDDIWKIWRYSGSGQPTYVAGSQSTCGLFCDPLDGQGAAGQFYWPDFMATDAAGNLYVADNAGVRKVGPDGQVSTIAGSVNHPGMADGDGKNARFNRIISVTSDPEGNLVIAEDGRAALRRLTAAGQVSTIESTRGQGYVDGTGEQARFNSASQPAVDSAGNVYLADRVQYVIRKISPDGTVSLFSGKPGTKGSQDGALAQATFSAPRDMATGPGGTLFVLDGGLVRRIANGTVSTVGRVSNAGTLAVDSAGNVAVSNGRRIFQVSASGQVTVLLEDTALRQRLGASFPDHWVPEGLVYDAADNLYIADLTTAAVYRLAKTGEFSVFAGTPLVEGDQDGPAGTAKFNFSGGAFLARDASGNLYLAGPERLKRIGPAGVVSSIDLPWGIPSFWGITWANGKLYGSVNFAVLQATLP